MQMILVLMAELSIEELKEKVLRWKVHGGERV